MNESLQAYVTPTIFCDSRNPDIQKKALEIVGDSVIQTEQAKKLFYFVRDSIVYTVGNWNKKASETLKLGHGTCTNNANLFVALARSLGIPVGYGVMDVTGPEYFGPIILPQFAQSVSKRSKHVYAYIYLEEKWIQVDPSDDEPLSINTQHINPQSKIVEWNGISDAMLNLNPTHILKNTGPLANIDHILEKRQRRSLFIPVYLGNLYISFLREKGKSIQNISQLRGAFLEWLRERHFGVYVITRIFFVFAKLRQRFWKKYFNLVLRVR